MEKQKRDSYLHIKISEEERSLIEQKMKIAGILNMSAYVRKMAIDGHLIRVDLAEQREILSLLRYAGNNLNQIARRVNVTGRIYENEISELKELFGTLIAETRTVTDRMIIV